MLTGSDGRAHCEPGLPTIPIARTYVAPLSSGYNSFAAAILIEEFQRITDLAQESGGNTVSDARQFSQRGARKANFSLMRTSRSLILASMR